MKQLQSFQRVLFLTLAALTLVPLSVFSEERPDWRTVGSSATVQDREQYDLEGSVISVDPSGDSFMLRTRSRTVHVIAKGGVVAYFNGQRYRIRDLERGDYIAVDLFSNGSRQLHARSVHVIESISHGGRARSNDRYRDSDRYGYDRVLEGRIVSINARSNRFVVQTSRARIEVDGRQLARRYGRDWARSFRVGERVEVYGEYRGRTFIAESFDRDRRYDDRRDDRGRR